MTTSTKLSKRTVLILIGIVLLLVGLFIILKHTVNFNVLLFIRDLFNLKFVPELGANASLWLLFVVGLLTSIHCMGMCGGIMLTQTVKKNENAAAGIAAADSKPKIVVLPAALYNLGRVISYTLIGAIVGGIGQVLTLSNTLKGLIPIIGGLFMIVMAINLMGFFPFLRHLQIGLPNSVIKKVRRLSGKSPLIVGLLTGLMPCGPLQIVQLYALGTHSVIYGAVSMFVFSLGTVPGLFAFGALSSLISKRFSTVLIRISAILVALLGVIMIGRGLALEGVTLHSSVSKDSYIVSTVSGDVQTVTTTIGDMYFPPIEVSEGIKVIWTIKVDKEHLNDCNKAMVVPEYGIEKSFTIGDNVVEFMPDKTGEFTYTCWMGMIKSKIRVVPNGS